MSTGAKWKVEHIRAFESWTIGPTLEPSPPQLTLRMVSGFRDLKHLHRLSTITKCLHVSVSHEVEQHRMHHVLDLDTFGYLWIPLDTFGYLGILLDTFGYLWIPLDTFGYL